MHWEGGLLKIRYEPPSGLCQGDFGANEEFLTELSLLILTSLVQFPSKCLLIVFGNSKNMRFIAPG